MSDDQNADYFEKQPGIFQQLMHRWSQFIGVVLAALLLMGTAPGWANPTEFLADRHETRGLTCAQCHTEDPPAKQVETDKCLSCHISYESLAQKTKALERNPHDSHMGEIDCSDCHKGHLAPVLVCNDCHTYDMKVP